jgi:hypothetical protein
LVEKQKEQGNNREVNMPVETFYNIAFTGLLLNILSTKPLVYAEIVFTEDCIHTLLVWGSFLMFLFGSLCAMIGGLVEHNWFNTGGLLLEILGTLFVTPELLINLHALDKTKSWKTTLLLIFGVLFFIVGLGLEFYSTQIETRLVPETTIGTQLGLFLAFLAFLPFLFITITPEFLLASDHKALQWLIYLLITAVVVGVIVFLVSPETMAKTNDKMWGPPIMLLILLSLLDMVELSVARDYGVLNFRLMLFSFGLALIRTSYFFQLFALHYNYHPLKL